jgi:DNA-binding transcriptional regulator YiaG
MHTHAVAIYKKPKCLKTKIRIPKVEPFVPKTFGEHIRSLRFEEGIQQRDLAALLGVTADTIRNWEAGRVVPKRWTLERIRRKMIPACCGQ